jgi:hypothetical protein
MIIHPTLPSGFVIFCDDIRHEIGDKATYVGVYTGQMILVGNLPMTLPKLCAAITLRISPPTEIIRPIIRMHISGQDQPLFEFMGEIQPVTGQQNDILFDQTPDSITIMQMGAFAQMQGIMINEPSKIRVSAYIGDDEYRLGTLDIIPALPLEVNTKP